MTDDIISPRSGYGEPQGAADCRRAQLRVA